jgi:predicted metal-dependent HD superfamily phosphohydrolase
MPARPFRELLWPRWCDTFLAFGVSPDLVATAFSRLADAYSERGRFYHTLEHLIELLEVLSGFQGGNCLQEIEVAAWFHDVVYDPRALDNEEQSAAWMNGTLCGFGIAPAIIQRSSQLIMYTKTHDAPRDDRAAAILLDADLAILGAAPSRYDAYASGIRQEHAWVSERDYRQGRTRVLQSFLQRDRIYRTDALFGERETQARANIAGEIEKLALSG